MCLYLVKNEGALFVLTTLFDTL